VQPFTVDYFLSKAQADTGLSDFGPTDFLEGLTVFIDSINAQGELSEARLGKFEERVLTQLKNRLWFAKDLAEHPEILDERIISPVVIISLPRTASTKIHRMLGATTDFQSLRMWQSHMFARIPGFADGGIAQRIQATRDYEEWMYKVSPESISGHSMFTDETEEDITLLGECTFQDPYISNIFNVPSYTQWMMATDIGPRYAYFRDQIKYLQWQRKPERRQPWLLKSPLHLGGEAALQAIFENPRFIFTHRDPVKCMPSIANPVRHFRKMYSDIDTASSLGPALIGLFGARATTHLQWRDDNPSARVLDLSMTEITRDGIGAAKKVYEFLDMPVSPVALQAMNAWEQDNQLGKHGANVYAADEIGTSEAAIRAAFAPYIERYSPYF